VQRDAILRFANAQPSYPALSAVRNEPPLREPSRALVRAIGEDVSSVRSRLASDRPELFEVAVVLRATCCSLHRHEILIAGEGDAADTRQLHVERLCAELLVSSSSVRRILSASSSWGGTRAVSSQLPLTLPVCVRPLRSAWRCG
jgi:hypothetical protein